MQSNAPNVCSVTKDPVFYLQRVFGSAMLFNVILISSG